MQSLRAVFHHAHGITVSANTHRFSKIATEYGRAIARYDNNWWSEFLRKREAAMKKMESGPGACISGELRTFFAPCVGAQIRDNLLLPLKLRTHIFMNMRTWANDTEARVRRVLKNVDIAALNVEYFPSMDKPSCPVKGTSYALTGGLARCFYSLQADTRIYTWIVRIRSDHMVPFRIDTLPCAKCYYSAHPWASGIVLSASLADCTCGWIGQSCGSTRTYCDWVDDQFALLHGSAIQSYMETNRVRFCDHRFLGLSSYNYLGLMDPERRMARMLRNATVHDMRFISSAMHPRLQRTLECDRAGDGRVPVHTHAAFDVPSRSMKAVLPTGPWDQRRTEICNRQRKLPLHDRYLCLLYGPEYDDVRHAWKPHYNRMLRSHQQLHQQPHRQRHRQLHRSRFEQQL